MMAIPSKSQEITRCTVETHLASHAGRTYVYLTIETDADRTVYLCLNGVESVDDMIDKLIAVRNRTWPFPLYQVE